MRIKIGHRLFIGFLLIAFLVLLVSSGLTRWNFQRGFLNYVNDSEAERLQYIAVTLAGVFGEENSWEPLRNNPQMWLQLMGPPPPTLNGVENREPFGQGRAGPPGGSIVSDDPLAISPRISVLDEYGNPLFGPLASDTPQRTETIFYGGAPVGNLILNPLATLANDLDVSFAEQQNRWIYGTALVSLLLAGFLAMIFAHQIASPIANLAKGARALTAGQFGERIKADPTVEFGDLAIDFNTLAETLEKNQQTQQQWIANISHELRTPLSVLRGELQAVEDGVRKLDEITRKSLATEVEHLTKLVNDIYALSVSDVGALRYQKAIDNVADVLQETVELFEPRILNAGLELQVSYPPKPLNALIDGSRLRQLFTNVLENSIRYTDDGGTLLVSCAKNGSGILINIEDSAPSVPEDGFPKLFEKLYRVESSRGRLTGGAGLGLAICKNIVHAHSGEISATQSKLGGVNVEIRLPDAGPEDA